MSEKVYSCPFCSEPVWFSRRTDFEFHLFKDHFKEALNFISERSLIMVKKSLKRWIAV
jgi:hypothetical protein